MPKQINGRTYYRTAEACIKAGISKATLFRWIRMGLLKDVGLKDRNGWRLFSDEDIAQIRTEVIRNGSQRAQSMAGAQHETR